MITKATIPQPCPVNWEAMKIGIHSRFCDNCKKDVVDFTTKDRQQILEYLIKNYNKKVCGHINPSQLDFSHADFLITIKALSKQAAPNTNLPFYLLAMGALLLASCNDHTGTTDGTKTGITRLDTTKVNSASKEGDTNTTCNTTPNQFPKVWDGVIEGEIIVSHPDTTFEFEPYRFVEIMPEFKGGLDSLIHFVTRNLNYPDWEKKNNIHGKVFASFVVEKTGKIKDAKILKSVPDSKNFDSEVLRIVNSMPDWTPGQKDGKKVDVKFTIPVHFKL